MNKKKYSYQYQECGLPNVYLDGIEEVEIEGEGKVPVIPKVGDLLAAIARAVISKKSPLTGEEFRFIRKRMGMSAKEFAAAFHYAAETISRYENGASSITVQLDMNIRMYYAIKCKESLELDSVWQANWNDAPHPNAKIEACFTAERGWQVKAA